jgi:hypothetical protein
MPSYVFRNKETGEIHEDFMMISAMEQYLADNPQMETVPSGAPMIGYSFNRQKPDGGFRDVLKNIKSHHRGSNINTW